MKDNLNLHVSFEYEFSKSYPDGIKNLKKPCD